MTHSYARAESVKLAGKGGIFPMDSTKLASEICPTNTAINVFNQENRSETNKNQERTFTSRV